MTLCEPWSHKIWRPKWLAWCDKARVRKLMTTVNCCCIRTSLNNLPWENHKPFLSSQIIKKLIRIIRIILWLFALKALTIRDFIILARRNTCHGYLYAPFHWLLGTRFSNAVVIQRPYSYPFSLPPPARNFFSVYYSVTRCGASPIKLLIVMHSPLAV